ncbi:MAG: porin [bacterium]
MRAVKLMLCLAAFLFVWSSANGQENVVSKKSRLTFAGRLHGQFHTSNVEAAEEMNNTFYIRRARLTAKYENPQGTMKAKVQYDLGGGGVKLKDGYVDLTLDPKFNIKLGQYKKQFSLWELTSSTKTMVIERGNKLIGSDWKATNQIIIKDGLYAGRDIGVTLHGKVEKVKYYLGVFNGNGYHKKADDDNGKLIGGRVVLSALEDLAFGASVANRTVSNYEKVADSDTSYSKENFQAFEADVEYGIKHHVSKTGPWVQAEFLYGSNPYYDDETDFMGFAFIGSYNVKLAEGGKIYSVRPAIRFDYAQRDTDDDDTRNILVTPGVDIFFDKYNRVQINLDVNMPQKDGADTEYGLRVQFQMHI